MFGAGCTRTGEAPIEQLTIASGPEGGVYFQLGQALAAEARKSWGIDASAYQSNDSEDNLIRVADRIADAGFATVDTCARALEASGPFTWVLPIAAIAALYEDYLHVIVRADSDIAGIAQLKGRRVVIGSGRSLAERVLFAAGLYAADLRLSDMSIKDAVQALHNNDIEALLLLGGLETPALDSLRGRIRLLSLADEAAFIQDRFGESYLQRTVPAKTYGLTREVVTIGVGNVLVVNKHLPETTAYRLTELLFAAKPELVKAHSEARHFDARSAIITSGVPLHEGAARYYRETKPFAR